MEKERGISAFWLKLFAMAAMLIDHMHIFFYSETPYWVGFIGAFVAPLFTYFIIEGFFHTKSRHRYCFRLYMAAFVMGIGTAILNQLLEEKNLHIGKNIFLTLAVLFTIIWLLNMIRSQRHEEPKVYWFLLVVAVLCLATLKLEGGAYLLPFALIAWYFYGRRRLQLTGFCLLSIAFFAKALLTYYTGGVAYTSLAHYLAVDRAFLMIAAVPLICLYNGKRGPSGLAAKWMFYVFYPLHLWIIGILAYAFH